MRVIARPAFENRRLNPYNALLYGAMQEQGATVTEYLGGRWLLGRYDVLHVHWPESTFNHGLAGALLVTQTLLRAMDLLRARGTRCFWTAHNLEAHERRHPEHERAFWRAFVQRLDGFFVLTESALVAVRERFPELLRVPGFVVPHPHYRGAYDDHISRAEARTGFGLPVDAQVITYLGQILDYKNVPQLVRVFRAAADQHATPLRLLVAGKPRTPRLVAEIEAARDGDPRVQLALRFVPAGEVQRFMRAADLVALPYREILNSGSAVLALSFDRSVLMPAGLCAQELARLVGEAWVHAYDELTPQTLLAALRAASVLPERTDGGWLHACDPSTLARATLQAYEQVLGKTQGVPATSGDRIA